MGMLKCTVLHMQMIKVLKQNVMIPKVPRFFGSPSHKYEGLLGEVALAAGLLICFVDQSRRWFSKVKSVEFTTAARASRHLYASILCALRCGM